MIRVCIFDLDGTLANTLESMAHAANAVLGLFGMGELPVDNFRYYCGDGAEMLVRRILKDAGDEELKYFEQAAPAYREIFKQDPLYHVTPYEGMREVLKKLKDHGILLAVCSNKPHGPTVQAITGLFGDTFHMILGQQEGLARKPAPDPALRIAGELGVKPEECMYIGDTHTDMETGNSAGMFTVGALWGYRDREELVSSGAQALAKTPEELWEILQAHENGRQ